MPRLLNHSCYSDYPKFSFNIWENSKWRLSCCFLRCMRNLCETSRLFKPRQNNICHRKTKYLPGRFSSFQKKEINFLIQASNLLRLFIRFCSSSLEDIAQVSPVNNATKHTSLLRHTLAKMMVALRTLIILSTRYRINVRIVQLQKNFSRIS